MNREKLLHTINLLTAVSQGKKIEYRNINRNWIDSASVAEGQLECLFNSGEDYRVKPEPKYRRWELHEIPVGAVARRSLKHANKNPQLIIAADLYKWRDEQPGQEDLAYAVMQFENSDNCRTDRMLTGWEWKWAHEDESAWRICGVAESEA